MFMWNSCQLNAYIVYFGWCEAYRHSTSPKINMKMDPLNILYLLHPALKRQMTSLENLDIQVFQWRGTIVTEQSQKVS